MAEDAVPAVVRVWHDEDGWGVVDCGQTPGGCWAGFSAVAVEGYQRLAAGEEVMLECEVGEQDGFGFRAVRVWPVGADPVGAVVRPAGQAYRSTLRIEPDPH